MFIKVKSKWQTLLDFFMIFIGTCLMGFAFSIFLEPNNISTGGFSGLSMIFNELLIKIGIKFLTTSIIYFVLNIGLFLYALKTLGKKFAIRALFGIVSFSLSMELFGLIPFNITYEPLISAVYGGVIMGIGVGLVVRFGGSTGGGDMIASIVRKKNEKITIGTIVLIIDMIVIILSIFTFSNGVEILPYTIVALGLSSFCTDFVNDGYKQVRAYYIITSSPDIIGEKIMSKLSRGCTATKVTGMHSHDERTCLMCLVSKFQSPHLIRIVKKYDAEAFVFSTKINEVVGRFNSTSEVNKEVELNDNIDLDDDSVIYQNDSQDIMKSNSSESQKSKKKSSKKSIKEKDNLK